MFMSISLFTYAQNIFRLYSLTKLPIFLLVADVLIAKNLSEFVKYSSLLVPQQTKAQEEGLKKIPGMKFPLNVFKLSLILLTSYLY